jgi:glutamate-1-semialdehyde 2,1-aminomutase
MDDRNTTLGLYALGAAALGFGLRKLKARIELSRAKHPSLAGHSRMSRRAAALVPFYDYGEETVFRSDGVPDEVAQRRGAAFLRLAEVYRTRFAETRRRTAEVRDGISDLQFTDAYRVPFQYSCVVRRHLGAGTFVASSSGVTLTDLDGNAFYDLSGAYGVNLLGYDFYKACMARGAERVRDLGPVLGPYHPVVAYNVGRLREISGLDEVSFHMSGT